MSAFVMNAAQKILKAQVECSDVQTLAQTVPDLLKQCLDNSFAVPFGYPSQQNEESYVHGCRELRHLALLEMPAHQYCDLPLLAEDLIILVLNSRRRPASSNNHQIVTQTQVVDQILAFAGNPYNHEANARFLAGHGSHNAMTEEEIAAFVSACFRDLQTNGIQHESFATGQLASICVLHWKLQARKIPPKIV